MASPSLLTVHLRGSASPPDAASSVAIEVEGGDGVDLAQVGLALGLDPATVGLNGYFLSCGSGYVSLAVTWGELLAFFATGGQPTGADPAEPVAVDGGPVPSPPGAPPFPGRLHVCIVTFSVPLDVSSNLLTVVL
uniref:Uncharacterized protein n=1 Tax=Aegilops tauschii subsp. strangulata TaxID=200361 RepID=A0A453GBB1_AEGTS